MSMYDGRPWAELAKRAGFVPEDTESAARRAFEFGAEVISETQKENDRLRRDLEKSRMAFAEFARRMGDL